MYNVRFRLIIVLVAFFLSAGLWALGIFFTQTRPPESVRTQSVRTRGKYAVLVLDDAIPDREIRAGLESSGFSGIISESTQRVFLDSFGSIEQIPLDEYDKRVFPFDPRNDGYAEKLRSLFVRDGRRFVYLPLGFATRAGMEKRIATAMGDIPYSLELTVPASRLLPPPWLLITLFCAAAGALLIIPPLRKALRPDAAFFLPCLPALAPLALAGAAGFALAALLAGFAVLITAFFFERSGIKTMSLQKSRFRRLPPFLFIVGCGIIVFLSKLPVIFAAAVFVLLAGALAFSIRGASTVKNEIFKSRRVNRYGHRRFVPVPIIRRGLQAAKPASAVFGNFGFALVLLPFAIVAFALAVLDIAAPRPSVPGVPSRQLFTTLSEEDYYNHFLFQSTFSYRSLNSPNDVSLAGLSAYEFDDDGLPVKTTGGDPFLDTIAENIPPFPLRDLLQQIGGR